MKKLFYKTSARTRVFLRADPFRSNRSVKQKLIAKERKKYDEN